jgi:hypothetical protein
MGLWRIFPLPGIEPLSSSPLPVAIQSSLMKQYVLKYWRTDWKFASLTPNFMQTFVWGYLL